jgi:hypothetical protein
MRPFVIDRPRNGSAAEQHVFQGIVRAREAVLLERRVVSQCPWRNPVPGAQSPSCLRIVHGGRLPLGARKMVQQGESWQPAFRCRTVLGVTAARVVKGADRDRNPDRMVVGEGERRAAVAAEPPLGNL